MTTRRMRIAYWIPKATNAHSEHVIIMAFPLQQSLLERVSVLRYTYVSCLVSKYFCRPTLINICGLDWVTCNFCLWAFIFRVPVRCCYYCISVLIQGVYEKLAVFEVRVLWTKQRIFSYGHLSYNELRSRTMNADENDDILCNSTKQTFLEQLLWKICMYTVWIRKWQLQFITLNHWDWCVKC